MCGRTACTLEPGVIQKACSYKDTKVKTFRQPEWKDHPTSKGSDVPTNYQYYPSANVTPTKFTPVLLSDGNNKECQILQPMMWGMIPPWHKGDPKSHGMSTNNARLEGLKESKLFRRPLKEKRLCVVVAQGFYEWKEQTQKKTPKQPYFIFMSQEDVKGCGPDDVADEGAWNRATWDEEDGWTGPRILMMAGLYDVWNSPKGEPVYSYSIITRDSNKTLSWLHHRMPAILETPEQVQAWLNPDPNTSVDELISILTPTTALQWYTVNPKVGNSRCFDADCARRYEPKENKGKSFMENWLKRTPKVKADNDTEASGSSPKKPKREPEEEIE